MATSLPVLISRMREFRKDLDGVYYDRLVVRQNGNAWAKVWEIAIGFYTEFEAIVGPTAFPEIGLFLRSAAHRTATDATARTQLCHVVDFMCGVCKNRAAPQRNPKVALARAVPKRIDHEDVCRIAKNTHQKQGSQRFGQLDYHVDRNGVLTASHFVTGTVYGQIDLTNGTITEQNPSRLEILRSLYAHLETLARVAVTQEGIALLRHYPFKNKEQIDKLRASIGEQITAPRSAPKTAKAEFAADARGQGRLFNPPPSKNDAARNKFYEKLLSRAELVGQDLYFLRNKQITPAVRKALASDYDLSRGSPVPHPQSTHNFHLREKSEATGRSYDEGWLLSDRRAVNLSRAVNPKVALWKQRLHEEPNYASSLPIRPTRYATAADFAYWKAKAQGMTDAELLYSASDAHIASRACGTHDEIAGNKYRDEGLTYDQEMFERRGGGLSKHPKKPKEAPPRPFSVGDLLIMKSAITKDERIVNYRGLMPDGHAMVVSNGSQFSVPLSWLRHQPVRNGSGWKQRQRATRDYHDQSAYISPRPRAFSFLNAAAHHRKAGDLESHAQAMYYAGAHGERLRNPSESERIDRLSANKGPYGRVEGPYIKVKRANGIFWTHFATPAEHANAARAAKAKETKESNQAAARLARWNEEARAWEAASGYYNRNPSSGAKQKARGVRDFDVGIYQGKPFDRIPIGAIHAQELATAAARRRRMQKSSGDKRAALKMIHAKGLYDAADYRPLIPNPRMSQAKINETVCELIELCRKSQAGAAPAENRRAAKREIELLWPTLPKNWHERGKPELVELLLYYGNM